MPDSLLLTRTATEVGQQLQGAGLRVAVAESCTGGWICKVLTDPPGSSAWFDQGLVAYSNAAKVTSLGVAVGLLDSVGAVSEEVVRAMANGLVRRCSAELVLAVSGISGPTGGSPEKPVGTVWMAVQRRGRSIQTQCFLFHGGRDAVRRQVVLAALGLLADAVEER